MTARLFSAMLLLASFSLASATKTNDFIITNSDTILCQNAKEGVFNIKATDTNGNSIKVDKEDVESYVANGKVYEKLPIVINGKAIGEKAFVQLISRRNELKLCKYTYVEDGETKNVLLVYKGNDYYVSLDKKNADGMLDFFHVSGVDVR